jgi:hypothetical protein
MKTVTVSPPLDFWDTLTNAIKCEVDLTIEELDAGKGIPHEEVMKKYEKYIKER